MVRKDRRLKTEPLQQERNFLPRQKEKQSKKLKTSCKTVGKCIRIHSLQTSAKRYTGNKMALIEKISSSDLYHMACRMDRGANFGYTGWNAIGDYLEQLSDDLGEDLEIDIVAICCDYNMVESIDEFLQEFPRFLDEQGIDSEEWQEWDDNEKLSAISEYLSDNSSCIAAESDMIIWQAF